MQCDDVINNFFVEVIYDEYFTLGLDSTGVYAFTESADGPKTVAQFNELRQDLGLRNSEIVLCRIGQDVSDNGLLDWLQEKVSERPKCFSRKELQEIEDCYNENEEDDLSLINTLREFELSDGIIHAILESEPRSVKEIENLGVVSEVAEQVFDLLTSDDDDGPAVPHGISATLVSYQKKQCIKSLVCVMISAVVLILSRSYAASLIFAFIALIAVRRSSKKFGNVMTSYTSFVAIAALTFYVVGVTMKVLAYFMDNSAT